tara:strand:+ start:124204 stop:125304 length:1101 start_codon:yes stop_codon:yes gene_type:complete
MKLPLLGDKTDRVWSSVNKVIKKHLKDKNQGFVYRDLCGAVGDSYPAIKDEFLKRHALDFLDGLEQLFEAEKISVFNLTYTIEKFMAVGHEEVVSDALADKYSELALLIAGALEVGSHDHTYLTKYVNSLIPNDRSLCKLTKSATNNILRSELYGFARLMDLSESSFMDIEGLVTRLDEYKDILGGDYCDYAQCIVHNLDAEPNQLPLFLLVARVSKALPADRAAQMRDVLNEKFSLTLEAALSIDDKPALVMLAEYVQRLADYGVAVDVDAISILDTETVRTAEGAELSAMVVCFNRVAKNATKTEYVTLSRLSKRSGYDRLNENDKFFSISHDFKAALTEKYQESGAALAKKLMVNAPHIGFIS